MRQASAEAIRTGNPFGFAGFPLVPYSNRIAQAHFTWDGEAVQLARNFPPEDHSLHGVGWQRGWTMTAQAEDRATLSLIHAPDADWPWSFEATQRFVLTEHGLSVSLAVTNCADRAVPLAAGYHPYFDLEGARLRFVATSVWLASADLLPTEASRPEGQLNFDMDAPVAGRTIDNCYVGVDGSATIAWDDRPMALEIRVSPPAPAVVVYVPQHGDAFCFEPVPHINNALNLPGEQPAMPVLSPGAKMETSVHFQAFCK